MFEDCRQNQYADYICGVPDAPNHEDFDFAFLKLNNQNSFDLVTIDVTSGSIEEKMAKKTTDTTDINIVPQHLLKD
jgi:hypothetical protein